MKVLIEIEGADLHAKDVLYHPSCYKWYTSTSDLERCAAKHVKNEPKDGPHHRVFMKLVKDVEGTILKDTSSVTDLSQLREQYNTYLIDEGV